MIVNHAFRRSAREDCCMIKMLRYPLDTRFCTFLSVLDGLRNEDSH